MPNLIIKPQANSGNKVIIQNQGGTEVITTDDTGGAITNCTNLETTTTAKVKMKGSFMQSSTHQAWVMGG
jgi:hypothetical protein